MKFTLYIRNATILNFSFLLYQNKVNLDRQNGLTFEMHFKYYSFIKIRTKIFPKNGFFARFSKFDVGYFSDTRRDPC